MAKEERKPAELSAVEKRVEGFNKELGPLQKKWDVVLYAVNQVMEGGEVVPVLKLRDSVKPDIITDQK